jgi:hypothetical protein
MEMPETQEDRAMSEQHTPIRNHRAKSMKARTLLFRGLALGVALACSGCATTLGYVPAYPKPGGDGKFLHLLPNRSAQWGKTPTYDNVHRWAYDVMDAYGSRATINRHIDSAGASLAVTGAAAMVGLATLGSGTSPWIKGLPIGTSFAAGIMTVYANQAKAEIYAAAANYVERMITNSDRRFATFKLGTDAVSNDIDAKVENLNAQISSIEAALAQMNADIAAQLKLAHDASESVAASSPATGTDTQKAAENARQNAIKRQAKAAQDAADLARQSANNSEAQNTALQQQREALLALQKQVNQHLGLAAVAATAEKQSAPVTPVAPSGDSTLMTYESLCLRDDVMDVKERVDNLVEDLTPANISDSLKGVGSISGKKNGDWVPTNVIDRAQKDLEYLQSPIVSKCGVF